MNIHERITEVFHEHDVDHTDELEVRQELASRRVVLLFLNYTSHSPLPSHSLVCCSPCFHTRLVNVFHAFLQHFCKVGIFQIHFRC